MAHAQTVIEISDATPSAPASAVSAMDTLVWKRRLRLAGEVFRHVLGKSSCEFELLGPTTRPYEEGFCTVAPGSAKIQTFRCEHRDPSIRSLFVRTRSVRFVSRVP